MPMSDIILKPNEDHQSANIQIIGPATTLAQNALSVLHEHGRERRQSEEERNNELAFLGRLAEVVQGNIQDSRRHRENDALPRSAYTALAIEDQTEVWRRGRQVRITPPEVYTILQPEPKPGPCPNPDQLIEKPGPTRPLPPSVYTFGVTIEGNGDGGAVKVAATKRVLAELTQAKNPELVGRRVQRPAAAGHTIGAAQQKACAGGASRAGTARSAGGAPTTAGDRNTHGGTWSTPTGSTDKSGNVTHGGEAANAGAPTTPGELTSRHNVPNAAARTGARAAKRAGCPADRHVV